MYDHILWLFSFCVCVCVYSCGGGEGCYLNETIKDMLIGNKNLTFLKTYNVWEIRQNSVSPAISTCWALFQSGAPRCSHPHNNPVENLVEDIFFPYVSTCFGPKIKHYIYNITTLKRRYTKVVSKKKLSQIC